MSSFERLHAALQYHVVNTLRWPALRPLQEQAIGPVLDGHHCLLLAPTAGGKTEAAALPVISQMAEQEWSGPSVLYLCPIKALLNNLEPRLTELTSFVGRTAAVWHGDIRLAEKKAAERDLPDVLLTTPESLEGMLLSQSRNHHRLLGGIRCVIADELHAFAGDDRGWHMLALLERIRDLSGREMQRIGLSATVGEPESLLDWFAGHCDGQRKLVKIPAAPAGTELKLDHAGSVQNAAYLISRLHRGEKRLAFCESRGMVEDLAQQLRSLEVATFVSHSALSVDARHQAESAFAVGQNCVIVSTSTLELGLDVGDLDRVIQIDAPGTVASFLQRMGRTGRRAGANRNTLFISTEIEGFLLAAGVINLFKTGYVEPVVPPPFPAHLLVQQLLAAALQFRNALDTTELFSCLSRVPEFRRILNDHAKELLQHLEAEGQIAGAKTALRLGPESERRFTGKGLAELCVSFDTNRMLEVFQGQHHLGSIEPKTISDRPEETKIIALAGRAWRIIEWDERRHRVYVETSATSGETKWNGNSRGISRSLAQSIKQVLSDSSSIDEHLTTRAQRLLSELKQDLAYTLSDSPAFDSGTGTWEWWTYDGDQRNRILAARIQASGGACRFVDGFHLRIKKLPPSVTDTGDWNAVDLIPIDTLDLRSDAVKFEDLLPESLTQALHLSRIAMEI